MAVVDEGNREKERVEEAVEGDGEDGGSGEGCGKVTKSRGEGGGEVEYSWLVVSYFNKIGTSDCSFPSAKSDENVDERVGISE